MPLVPVNYVAILVAAVASMIIGALWYGPLFGKLWMKLSGLSPEALGAEKKKGMGWRYLLMFVGSLLMADVLAHALIFASAYLKISGVEAGFTAGFWNWLGFVAPVTLAGVLWEGKSWKFWFLNNSHYLVSLIVMGIILSIWK